MSSKSGWAILNLSVDKLYSEAHGGMKVETKYGNAIWILIASFIVSVSSAFCLRLHIWSMKIEQFQYKYDESESSSVIMSSADLNFVYGTTSESTQSLH